MLSSYTVTANDGTTVKYTVTVSVAGFVTTITAVDKATVIVGEDIVLTGTFAKTGNVVELVKGDKVLTLIVKAQSETSITATVAKTVTDYGDYTLNVTSNGTKASYATKIAVATIPDPIIEAYSSKTVAVGDVVTLTGKHMADVTVVRPFVYSTSENAWVSLFGDITPEKVTATTVEFKIPAGIEGREIKVIISGGDKASDLPADADIIKVLDPTAPQITALNGDKFMEGRWITITGKNLKPGNGDPGVYFKMPGGADFYTGSFGNANADGTEVTVLLPSNIKRGKQTLYMGLGERPNTKYSNEVEVEIIENTMPTPEITSFSKLNPAEDEEITITGKNFTNMEDTRIQIYELVGGKWEKYMFILKPKSVSATSVSFALGSAHLGEQIKVTVIANGKESAMPTDANIITVQ